METLFNDILTWVESHHTLALVLVYVIALGESLAIVGTLVPGVAVMLMAGALAGLGVLNLPLILACAAAGAVTGDGLSYWLGVRYQEQLKTIWPLSRYPGLLPRGEAFFLRHGGKSVLFGRFVGPIRAVIPAVAGIMGMPRWRFYSVNILSGVLWAPATILPGVAFGAALSIAAEVASRLVLLVLGLVLVSWLLFLLIHFIYRRVQPHLEEISRWLVQLAHEHPHVGPVLGAVIDPEKPELKGLLILALLLVLASAGFFIGVSLLTQGQLVLRIDTLIHGELTALRMPWLHTLTAIPTAMTQPVNQGVVALLITAWLLWRRHGVAAGHWAGALALAVLIPMASALLMDPAAPEPLVGRRFVPDLALTLITAQGGIFIVMLARSLPPRWRWLPWSFGGVLLLLNCTALIYQNHLLMMDLLGAVCLGLALTALVGIAWRRHSQRPLPLNSLVVSGAMLLLVPAVAIPWWYPPPPSPAPTPAVLEESDWLAGRGQFSSLAPRPHPITVHWAARPEAIPRVLEQAGWAPAPALGWATGLRWFQPDAQATQLPVVPHVRNGFFPILSFSRPGAGKDELYVLRLWHSPYQLPDGRRILVGNVSLSRVSRDLPFIRLLRTAGEFHAATRLLGETLADISGTTIRKKQPTLQIITAPLK